MKDDKLFINIFGVSNNFKETSCMASKCSEDDLPIFIGSTDKWLPVIIGDDIKKEDHLIEPEGEKQIGTEEEEDCVLDDEEEYYVLDDEEEEDCVLDDEEDVVIFI